MSAQEVRVSPQWLRLREPADGASRSRRLARSAASAPGPSRTAVVHDLGCGSGSMGRWLAPLLPGPQHWVLHDRDVDLLRAATADPPPPAADGGAPVTVEPRPGDLSRLRPEDLAGASLVTASALLDLLTREELGLLVRRCVGAGCPALLTLSVTGRVALAPYDRLDATIEDAFNDHQQRTTGGRPLLGPEAVQEAVGLFRALGADVWTSPSPWRLGADDADLVLEWLLGWVGAACERQPELTAEATAYLRRRERDLEQGRLRVTVGHLDLLARPRGAVP